MSSGSQPSQSTVDLVDMWKRSEIPKSMSSAHTAAMTRSAISERYAGDRSVVWTNLSQMSPSDQAVFMSKLSSHWPYVWERRALNWPMLTGIFANCTTAALISTRINADMVLLNPKTPFLQAVARSPKAPFVMAVYSSGVTYFLLQQLIVNATLFKETEPCKSCLLTETVAISLFTGLIMPMIATPYLSYYVLLQRKNEKFPMIKNALEFLMLSVEGSKAARPLLLGLVPLQVAVAASSLFALLWGRERFFMRLDADPEFAQELLIKVQGQLSLKQRVQHFLRKLPIVSDVIGQEAPEKERVK